MRHGVYSRKSRRGLRVEVESFWWYESNLREGVYYMSFKEVHLSTFLGNRIGQQREESR